MPHKRLLWKIKNRIGLDGVILKWMEDFLKGREMRMVIRDKKSLQGKVISGFHKGQYWAQ